MRNNWIAVAVSALTVAALAFAATSGPPAKKRYRPISGDFWATRVAYPTMHFSPSWYLDAKPEDARVASGVPAGHASSQRSTQSPLSLDPESWTFLGPEPLVFGGYGRVSGRTNVIAVDPDGPDDNGLHTVLTASDGGGVWKSTNCCTVDTTWRNTTDQPDISGIAIGDLYIDPNDSNIVYAGTGDLRFGAFSFGTSGLLKSIDKGETWQVLGEDVFTPFYPPSAGLAFPQYQAIGKVVTDPADSSTLIVGTKTGLFFSYDGGGSWEGPCVTNTHASQRQDITGLLAVSGGSGTTLYAAIGTRGLPTTVQPDLANLGANGIYRAAMPASGCPVATDWTLLNNGWPAGTGDGNPVGKLLGRIELEIAPSDPSILYAMAAHATQSNVLGVWRSADGGDTWTQTTTSAGIPDGGGSQMWYDANLTIDPNDPNTVLLSGVDLYRSTNGGTTFQNMTDGYGSGNVHVDHHFSTYLPADDGGVDSDKVLVGVDGGVYYSSNIRFGSGGSNPGNRPTFIPLNGTIGSIEFYSGDITANFATAPSPGASGGAQDNGSSSVRWSNTDPGSAEWIVRNGGDGIYTRIEPVNEQRWYYASQNGNIAVSTTGPGGPLQPAAPNGWGGDTLSFVQPYEIYRYGALDAPGSGCTSSIGCTFMIAGTTRVWETIQGAVPRTSWYPNSPNLTKGNLGNRSFINQLAYSITTPNIAVAGTNDGNVWYGHGMNAGTANTATWVDVTGGNAVLPNRPVMDVVTDLALPLGAAGTDGGTLDPTPRAAYAALGGFDQNTPSQPGHIYQLQCEDHCATAQWRNISGNLPNIPANSVAINPNVPKQVFAGTDWGLYYTDDAFAEDVVWQRFDNGLPRVMIWDMAVDRGFTTLAVFTRGRGAWAWPLPLALPGDDVIFAHDFELP